jgi:hypothetical protein
VNESADTVRAAMLEAVEQQLREGDPPETQETLDRLMADGFALDEAKRMLAMVVSVELFDVMKRGTPFNRERFIANLRTLPDLPRDLR